MSWLDRYQHSEATNVLVTRKTIRGISNTRAQTIRRQMMNSRLKESLTFKKIWTGNFNCELAGWGIRPFKWNPKSYVVTFSGKFPEQAGPIFMCRNTNLWKFTDTPPDQYFIRISIKSQISINRYYKLLHSHGKSTWLFKNCHGDPFIKSDDKNYHATEDSDIEQMQIPSTVHSLWSSTRFAFGPFTFSSFISITSVIRLPYHI